MSRSRSSKKRKVVDDDESSVTSEPCEYVAEKIVEHHGHVNKISTLRFRVRWEGYDEKSDTWEPYDHVSDSLCFEEYIKETPSLQPLMASEKKKRTKPTPARKKEAQPSEHSKISEHRVALFPTVTPVEKEVIFEQLQKLFLKKKASAEHLEALLVEYLRFIYVKISKPHISFQPCVDVDKMWHAHIICTRLYHEFCARCNSGSYIHHVPDRNNNVPTYRNTLREYSKLFEFEPNPVFWGGSSSFDAPGGYTSTTPVAVEEKLVEVSKKNGVHIVKIPEYDISAVQLDSVEQPVSALCTRTERLALCETNALQKLKIIFDISEIKYKTGTNDLHTYVGEQATSTPGCSSNAIFFCKKCRHIWEFGFCDRDSSCLGCEDTPGSTAKGGSQGTIDYIVRCFGCG